jgi:hydrogenase expression/formation protein HypC
MTGSGAAECHGDACITCGDVAVEVTVLRLLPDELAVVDTGQGTEEEVSVALVSAAAGDTILVHASEAIAVVSRAGVASAPAEAGAPGEVTAG